ncbi:MAG: hypothetical protein QNJ54_01355 [Prochloraceae cyanobacterium]|nr:hypothetical protein [Prochloraceae cyanobacterium]
MSLQTIPYQEVSGNLEDFLLELIDLKQKHNKGSISLILPAKNESRVDRVCRTVTQYLFGSYTIPQLTDKYSFEEIGSLNPISEVVLIDASHPEDGENFVDSAYLAAKTVLETTKEMGVNLDDFKNCLPFRINLLRRNPQMMQDIFKKSTQQYSLDVLLHGKGAGMYQGVALSTAPYIAFSDCDTKKYDFAFLFRLLKPFFATEKECFVTSHYEKGKYSNTDINEGLNTGQSFGGRANRLAFQTLYKALVNCQIQGFGDSCPRYALSGEFILPRDILDSIIFPTKYEIETVVNYFVLGKGLDILDIDLGERQHVPQSDDRIAEMARQIFDGFLIFTEQYFPEIYREVIDKKDEIIQEYDRLGKNVYALDEFDAQRVKRYTQILKNSFEKTKSFFMPSLQQLDYLAQRDELIARSNSLTQKIFQSIE